MSLKVNSSYKFKVSKVSEISGLANNATTYRIKLLSENGDTFSCVTQYRVKQGDTVSCMVESIDGHTGIPDLKVRVSPELNSKEKTIHANHTNNKAKKEPAWLERFIVRNTNGNRCGYQCCGMTFKNERHLRAHLIEKHKDSYDSVYCKYFENSSIPQKEIVRKTKPRPKKIWTTWDSPVKCSECGKGHTEGWLYQYKEGDKFVCSPCNYRLTQRFTHFISVPMGRQVKK